MPLLKDTDAPKKKKTMDWGYYYNYYYYQRLCSIGFTNTCFSGIFDDY